MQRSEELGLLVLDEDGNETLLLHRISAEDIYRKQEGILKLHSFVPFLPFYEFYYVVIQFQNKIFFYSDTIISWRDPEYSTELALSFQETTGCSYIW